MPFHRHVFLRAFWMKLQSPSLRTRGKHPSLYIIIKKDPVVNFHVSRSLHVLMCCISLLKKLMQYAINWTSSFSRKLQNIWPITANKYIFPPIYHWNQRIKKDQLSYLVMLVMEKHASFKTENKEASTFQLDREHRPLYCSFPWLSKG